MDNQAELISRIPFASDMRMPPFIKSLAEASEEAMQFLLPIVVRVLENWPSSYTFKKIYLKPRKFGENQEFTLRCFLEGYADKETGQVSWNVFEEYGIRPPLLCIQSMLRSKGWGFKYMGRQGTMYVLKVWVL